jgi:hypothetical protein
MEFEAYRFIKEYSTFDASRTLRNLCGLCASAVSPACDLDSVFGGDI